MVAVTRVVAVAPLIAVSAMTVSLSCQRARSEAADPVSREGAFATFLARSGGVREGAGPEKREGG